MHEIYLQFWGIARAAELILGIRGANKSARSEHQFYGARSIDPPLGPSLLELTRMLTHAYFNMHACAYLQMHTRSSTDIDYLQVHVFHLRGHHITWYLGNSASHDCGTPWHFWLLIYSDHISSRINCTI